MSKKLIAGAGVVASFAIALAPLATFADEAAWNSDKHTDTLDITVLPSCAFGNASLSTPDVGVAHTAGTAVAATDGGTAPSWTATTSNGTGTTPDNANGTNSNESIDTLTYNMFAGTTRNDLGTTTLKVFCNNNGGYTVKAATADLAEWSGSAAVQDGEEIPANASYSASASGYALYRVAAEAENGMTVDQGESAPYVNANVATKIAHKATPSKSTGDTLTITYGIGVQPSQKAANYVGSVVYTLVQGVNS